MLQVWQLRLVTSHPYLLFCRHIIPTMHFFFRKCLWALILSFFCQSSYTHAIKCGQYKASDLLLGDYVCEKSDAVNWMDCP